MSENLDPRTVRHLLPILVLLLALPAGCGSGSALLGSQFGDQINNLTGDTYVNNVDCNGNGIADQDDIRSGRSLDCNGNAIPDECDVSSDCNGNLRLDVCDIADGTSLDCNGNGLPDECEVEADCNDNGIPDSCDIASGASADCNENGIADDCEYDANGDGVPDECAPVESIARPREPGSLLVFPEFDNNEGVDTFLSLTNVETADGALDIDVRLVFVSGEDCSETELGITLTPGDNYTAITSALDVPATSGYVLAYAVEAGTGIPIVHNELIGSVLIVRFSDRYGLDAMAFQAIGEPRSPTDRDEDGVLDCDGVEYATAPAELLFSRFLGQDTEFQVSELILIPMMGGPATELVMETEWSNDNGEVFSAEEVTPCWKKERLTDITGVSSNAFLGSFTNHDPLEVIGRPFQEAGWIRIYGATVSPGTNWAPDPPLLAVLIEGDGSGHRAGEMPSVRGSRANGGFPPSKLPGAE